MQVIVFIRLKTVLTTKQMHHSGVAKMEREEGGGAKRENASLPFSQKNNDKIMS